MGPDHIPSIAATVSESPELIGTAMKSVHYLVSNGHKPHRDLDSAAEMVGFDKQEMVESATAMCCRPCPPKQLQQKPALCCMHSEQRSSCKSNETHTSAYQTIFPTNACHNQQTCASMFPSQQLDIDANMLPIDRNCKESTTVLAQHNDDKGSEIETGNSRSKDNSRDTPTRGQIEQQLFSRKKCLEAVAETAVGTRSPKTVANQYLSETTHGSQQQNGNWRTYPLKVRFCDQQNQKSTTVAGNNNEKVLTAATQVQTAYESVLFSVKVLGIIGLLLTILTSALAMALQNQHSFKIPRLTVLLDTALTFCSAAFSLSISGSCLSLLVLFSAYAGVMPSSLQHQPKVPVFVHPKCLCFIVSAMELFALLLFIIATVLYATINMNTASLVLHTVLSGTVTLFCLVIVAKRSWRLLSTSFCLFKSQKGKDSGCWTGEKCAADEFQIATLV